MGSAGVKGRVGEKRLVRMAKKRGYDESDSIEQMEKKTEVGKGK